MPSLAMCLNRSAWIVLPTSVLLFRLNQITSMSADLAHHGALVERLPYRWGASSPDSSLCELNFYQRGSHWLAVLMATLVNSPLIGMHAAALLSTVLAWGQLYECLPYPCASGSSLLSAPLGIVPTVLELSYEG